MFGHPMSKVGYALAALAVVGGFSKQYLPYGVGPWLETVVALFAIFGFCTVFLGVIARGFERVEAAILSNKDSRNT